MKVCLLSSGSSGNVVYVEAGRTKIIIDQGLSLKELTRRMNEAGLERTGVAGLLISHEHRDHSIGARVLANRWNVPIYTTKETHRAISNNLKGTEEIIYIKEGGDYWIGDIFFHPFTTSHDAVNPVQFTLTDGSAKLTLATDLGYISQLVYEKLRGSDLVILESNYDEVMLFEGPYPWYLKQRIKSREGHLANHDSAEVLARLAGEGLKKAILAHISEKNNTPELVLRTAKKYLKEAGCNDIYLELGNQYYPSSVVSI